MDHHKEWLVEIGIKNWLVPPKGLPRIVTYIEVLATNEYSARHAAIDEFERRCKYEPITKRRVAKYGFDPQSFCVTGAVALT